MPTDSSKPRPNFPGVYVEVVDDSQIDQSFRGQLDGSPGVNGGGGPVSPPAPNQLFFHTLAPTDTGFEWNIAHIQESQVDFFEVWKRIGTGTWHPYVRRPWQLGGSQEYTDRETVNGGTYSYRVRSSKNGIFSNFSNEITATILEPGEGGGFETFPAPTNLHWVDFTSTTVTLQWEDNSTGEERFELQRKVQGTEFSDPGTQTFEPPANSIEYTDAIAEPATTYVYRIRAVRTDVPPVTISDYSNEASGTTLG